ncbi:nitroreductase [Prolixibacter sp. SD074]|jgi:nitroreductase|nr:nitroreductase [Prolixibacter sp. SD074]
MKLRELIMRNRSYRRYVEEFRIDRKVLLDLVELTRYAASGQNAQPLKYKLSYEPEINEKVFEHLAWANYLTDWPGPGKGERPSAYILVLLDREIAQQCFCDDGIAMQNILLGAVDKGLGGCILRAVHKPALRKLFQISERYDIMDVVALGKPAEVIQIEDLGADGDSRYYRDEDNVHHVPKRKLADLVID